jgi:hypothetical protein
MSGGTVYQAGWSLEDIPWDRFDPNKVQRSLLEAVKAASLVEFNAPDYVKYLKRIFCGAPAATLSDIEQWGKEEIQHGLALGRWAELADPSFDFNAAVARFRAGYKPAHFTANDMVSVRGSRRGEMISRCVVESGTSSFYSAIRDAAEEPVLKEIAGRIAADEFRHYKLFLDTLHAQNEPELPFWKRLFIAVGRVNESDDDELAYAFYSANIAQDHQSVIPYQRARFARAYQARAMALYRRHHIRKLVQMVAKAVGANPQGRPAAFASSLMWSALQLRVGFAA